jgi:hypothetical protein
MFSGFPDVQSIAIQSYLSVSYRDGRQMSYATFTFRRMSNLIDRAIAKYGLGQPSLTLPALRQAVAALAPDRLPEMFTKMQEAFVRAGEEDSVTPIHMFYREWAVVVEIERHPRLARRLHEAERTLMSDDPQVRDAAIREAGEIVRAAHRAVAAE